MKKYVQNIIKLYSGQTANALTLDQVDDDFPVLIPSFPKDGNFSDIGRWVSKCKEIDSRFNPQGADLSNPNSLNKYIVDFNMNLQTMFKEKSHSELYMMDDTSKMRQNDDTHSICKRYMHCLNGKSDISNEENVVNSSQLNVLFPFKKMSSKSLYSKTLKLDSEYEIDDVLEQSSSITLQGKNSWLKSVQGVAQIGNNMYIMSPVSELLSNNQFFGNGMSIFNSGMEMPFHFPHAFTLFQPSQGQSANSTIQDFKTWYERHDRRTIVSFQSAFGGNVSTLKYNGLGSYEIDLSTYSPTNLILSNGNMNDLKSIRLVPSTFKRSASSQNDEFIHYDGKVSMSNGKFENIGFLFNLYDNYLIGEKRILKIDVPFSFDFNRMKLSFDCVILNKNEKMIGKIDDVVVMVNEEVINSNGHFEKTLNDMSLDGRTIEISITINHQVDYSRRNSEKEYSNSLVESGVLLNNIRILTDTSQDYTEHLTYGSYLNEDGISQEERTKRYESFWEVSRYQQDVSYQTILESSLKNVLTNGQEYRNNYSSGDMYGDMFVTKSMLNSNYDMDFMTIDNDKLRVVGREYIGLGQCSDQLYLTYNPSYSYVDLKNDVITTHRNISHDCSQDSSSMKENKLKYHRVEVIKNLNKFESSIKHKSNVFSIAINNSNLAKNDKSSNKELEEYKKQMRNSIVQFVRNACDGIVPVHTQLFDVQFT